MRDMQMRPVVSGHLESVETREEEAAESDRVLRQVQEAIDDVDGVRNRLTELYRSSQPGTAAEVEIGGALQSARVAIKRLRKAQVELMTRALPGM